MRNRVTALAAGGALAAVLSAGVIAGVVSARPSEQQSPTPTPRAGATATPSAGSQRRTQVEQRVNEYLDRLARNLGVTPDRLRDALKQTALEEVDAALARGDITQEQAQRLRDRINQAGGLGFFGPGFVKGFGPMGPGGKGDRVHLGIKATGERLAQWLGITEQQLRDELRGRSLAEVAQAHGKSRDQLKQFLLDNARQTLSDAVARGAITQQQADRVLQRLEDTIDQMIDRRHGDGMGGRTN
jgi:polyhydroxyalkanoate synthesis regulator phasin